WVSDAGSTALGSRCRVRAARWSCGPLPPIWTDPRLGRRKGSRSRAGCATPNEDFANFDPPQTFALGADEIFGNERQMVWRSGRGSEERRVGEERSRVRTTL